MSSTISIIGGNNNDYIIKVAWTATAGGVLSEVINSSVHKGGTLRKSRFVPGTPTPTDNFTATLLDETGGDVLAGTGATTDTGAASEKDTGDFGTDQLLVGDLTLGSAAVGASAQGTHYFYVSC